MAFDNHSQKKLAWFGEILLVMLALVLGILVAGYSAQTLVVAITGLLLFVSLRFAKNRSFYEIIALYIALAAFNFYYFYCAKLTGRNPTDLGTWGKPATTLEKLQKDIVLAILLLATLSQMVIGQISRMAVFQVNLNHPIYQVVGIYFVFCIIRSLFKVYENESLFYIFYYLRMTVMFITLPLILAVAVKKKSQLLRICKWWVMPMIIIAILGIVEFSIGGSPYYRSFVDGKVFYRATATLQNPNNLGAYLAVMLGVSGIFLFFKKHFNFFERIILMGSLPVGFVCLLMTLSRSSILFLFASLIICLGVFVHYQLFKSPQSRIKKEALKKTLLKWLAVLSPILVVLLVVSIQVFNLDQALSLGFSQYFNANSDQGQFRLFSTAVTFDYLLSHPVHFLFGSGWANYAQKPDNAFASMLMRNGLIGFMLYLTIWCQAFFYTLRGIYLNQSYQVIYWVSLYFFTFQALYGLTAPVHVNFPQNLYFWFMVGVIAYLQSPLGRKRFS
ncbi:MAG: O-antigen ligase family protein [Cyanobacteria bacterium P01_H01_bin.74]